MEVDVLPVLLKSCGALFGAKYKIYTYYGHVFTYICSIPKCTYVHICMYACTVTLTS